MVVTHAGVIRALRSWSRKVPYAGLVSEPVSPLQIEAIDRTMGSCAGPIW